MSAKGVQWVKNLTEVAQVAVEAQIQSLVQYSGLKDPALPQLQHRLKLQLGSDPWLGNSTCCGVATKRKKKDKTEPAF